MKRVFKFKLVLTIAALLLFASGSFAQILTVYQDVAETSYQTAGTSFRLYAYPDAVYSPTYVAATNANVSANARWTWTFAGLTATAPVVTATPVAQNFVEFTGVTAGTYTITVAESNTVGGCVDGTAESQDVTVIAAPTAAITTADPAQACGNQPSMNVALTFTEAVPAAVAGYAFAIRQTIENIDPSDAVIGAALLDADTLDFPTTAKLNTGNSLTGAASPYGFTFGTRALAVRNGLRTRYTYTLVKASDAPGAAANGVISAISQKSNYLAGTIQTYAFDANNSIVIIVNPAPVTGPIYHIPNNFAY